MSVLVELKSDQELLSLAAPFRTILIVGCRRCANLSLAFACGHPAATRAYDRGATDWNPAAIALELRRIQGILSEAGKNVLTEVEIPCLLTPDKEYGMGQNRTDIGAILCIGCVAGQVGIAKTVGDAIPVLSGVSTVGLLQPWLDVEPDYLRVNPRKSTAIRFPSPLDEFIDLTAYWAVTNKE